SGQLLGGVVRHERGDGLHGPEFGAEVDLCDVQPVGIGMAHDLPDRPHPHVQGGELFDADDVHLVHPFSVVGHVVAARPTAISMNSAELQPNSTVAVRALRPRSGLKYSDGPPAWLTRSSRFSVSCSASASSPWLRSPWITSQAVLTQIGPRHILSGEKSGSSRATVGRDHVPPKRTGSVIWPISESRMSSRSSGMSSAMRFKMERVVTSVFSPGSRKSSRFGSHRSS